MNIATIHKPFSRRTPEQWQQIIDDQQVSGLPQKAYCRQNGLSLATFCNWKKKLNNCQSPGDSSVLTPVHDWVEVPTSAREQQSDNWDMELELPGGVTLRIRQA